jgi:hypothetical protein
MVYYDESAKSGRKTKLTLHLVCITLLDQLNIVVMKTVFDFLPFRLTIHRIQFIWLEAWEG